MLEVEHPTRTTVHVAYQGEPGAYSEEALLTLFPDAEPVGHRTFTTALDALLGGGVVLAVIPVGNTLGGIVQESDDLLLGPRRLRILHQYVHPLPHLLLVVRGGAVE